MKKSPHLHNGRPTIGFLAHSVSDDYGMMLWEGVLDAVQEADVNLICFSSLASESAIHSHVVYDLINMSEIDGLVISGSALSHQLGQEGLARLFDRYRPLPMTSIVVGPKDIPKVVIEKAQGLRDLISHLIEVHNYRRIAFIRGPEGNPNADERYQIYADTLTQYGISVSPDLVAPGNFERPCGREAVSLLLDERHMSVEAIVAANDLEALGAMDALRERGLRVPDDIAVTGFDDTDEARATIPPLSTVTVRQPRSQMGYLAAKALIDLLKGEDVPLDIILPTEMIVRQSCGCQSPIVVQAAVMPTQISEPSSFAVLQIPREPILAAMQQAVKSIKNSTEWIELILDALLTDITGEQPGSFVTVWDEVLRQAGTTTHNITLWHNVISILRQSVLPYLKERHAVLRVEHVCQQVRVKLGEHALQVQNYQALQVKRRTQTLREIGVQLISIFDIAQLADVLAERLPQLTIPCSYVWLYEEPESSLEWAHLILAYTERGRIAIETDNQRFPARQLVPEGMWPEGRSYRMVLIPLYFQFTAELLGFGVFEGGPRDPVVYEGLRAYLASSFQGAQLIQRVQTHARELAEKNAELIRERYILDTFMATVPDSIYFKDHESRITHANKAHAASFGLSDPVEEIGKTDFDFFPEEQARPKFEQEQEIMRTGKPLLALEEPDAQGKWSLTTKMPLRDEYGEIIGTFGISRDITPLKYAQEALERHTHELAAAYEEIRILNEQLTEENMRMSAELNVARRLQEMVLPAPEELQAIEGLDIVGFMRPADEVGGDYYDVLLKHGAIHIGIGDVTGHGLESGVLMLMTQTAIRTLIEHGESDPVKFVNTLNHTIYKNAHRMGAEKTLTFTFINYAGKQMKIVGQHEEIIVVRQGDRVERIDTMDLGFPIGLEADISAWVAEATIFLQSGEGVVLYTDGITEAANMRNELYGLQRLCDVISQHWHKSAEGIKQAVVDDVIRFIGSQKVYDDLTLVVLKQN